MEGVRIDERLDVPALSIAPGERVLVTGSNGAGKTTLMRVLAGEPHPETGTVSATERVEILHQEEPISWLKRTVLQAYASGPRFSGGPSRGVDLAGVVPPGRYRPALGRAVDRSEEHTSELQSRFDLVCR